jgi:predicted nucleic acid-binding protein
VLDASVGVKWFKAEAGSDDARRILALHDARQVQIVVPSQFMLEVLAVASRNSVDLGREVWTLLRDADLTVVSLDDALADAALEQCRFLGCCFYDSLAPGLATLLGATLCSADAKAHARFPGVRLLG